MAKILILAINLDSGGAERQTVAIAKSFKEGGNEVTIACYERGDFYLNDLEGLEIPVKWILVSGYLKRIISFRKFIRSGGYDVVLSLLVTPNILNLLSAIGGKTWKVIVGERSAKLDFFKSLKAKVIRLMLSYADALVCNSQNAVSIWEKFAPKHSNKIKCIYNLLPEINPQIQYTAYQNNKVNVVVAASYQPLKNMKRLILALASLSAEERKKIQIDWYGRIDGAGYGRRPYEESQSLISEHNLESVISLNPPTRQIYDLMYKADAVALVSEVEGLPNVICEALMLGKPVIMSNVSDYKVLVGNKNGFICEYDDVNSIAYAIKSLINLNVEELTQMGIRSREIYTKKLSPDVIIKAWVDLIQ